MTRPRHAPRQATVNREAKMEELVRVVAENGGRVYEALSTAGVKTNTYVRWRERYPDFKARFDVAKLRGAVDAGRITEDPNEVWSFEADRLRWFKHHSPELHHLIIDAIDSTKPGNITMIKVPPESGKTTLFEDYASLKLAHTPDYRFTVGSEMVTLASKILARVMGRMEPEGPFPIWVARYGPFVPQTNTGRSTRQAWSTKAFNVYRKSDHDERDFNMQALGFGAQIRGTRTDHLHVDDPQSEKTLNQTDKMVSIFRHDWLSRPGERGITTINGTSVGEGDFYEVLEAELPPDILKVIKFPAIITRPNAHGEPEEQPLIPFDPATGLGWTMDGLKRIRAKVGEDGWAASYMMTPRSKVQVTFNDEVIGHALDPQRSVQHACPQGATLYFSLDPAIGSTSAFAAAAVTGDKLSLLDLTTLHGTMTNEALMNELERIMARYAAQGGDPTEVIIEAKNFQAGLARDERLLEICKRYGVVPREHLTDVNKYDENIGVASMVTSFRRGAISIPWAGDDETRERMQKLIDELLMWRPRARGNRLRQDRVMALWFLWIFWRERAGWQNEATSTITTRGMPYAPTRTGLLVPR